MAKIQIKLEKLTPFGGKSSIKEKFEQEISPVTEHMLGVRCTSYGFNIVKSSIR